MNSLDEIFDTAKGACDFADAYLDHVSTILTKIDRASISEFVAILLDARERGTRIFFIGNGGSAATATHFANDIAIGTRTLDKPFRAMSLTDNAAVITAIANDDGYNAVFVQQLKALAGPRDVVVAISASGNSSNVLQAVEWANDHNTITVGLTGFDGGALRNLAHYSVHVPTEKGEYGPVEDSHLVLDHLITNYLIGFIRAERALKSSHQE